MPQHGVYVSCHVRLACSCGSRVPHSVVLQADYTFKYSNDMEPLQPGEQCKVVMFRVLPGKSRKIEKRTPGLKPSDSAGFDSHL